MSLSSFDSFGSLNRDLFADQVFDCNNSFQLISKSLRGETNSIWKFKQNFGLENLREIEFNALKPNFYFYFAGNSKKQINCMLGSNQIGISYLDDNFNQQYTSHKGLGVTFPFMGIKWKCSELINRKSNLQANGIRVVDATLESGNKAVGFQLKWDNKGLADKNFAWQYAYRNNVLSVSTYAVLRLIYLKLRSDNTDMVHLRMFVPTNLFHFGFYGGYNFNDFNRRVLKMGVIYPSGNSKITAKITSKGEFFAMYDYAVSDWLQVSIISVANMLQRNEQYKLGFHVKINN